jgi:hypothetical protein
VSWSFFPARPPIHGGLFEEQSLEVQARTHARCLQFVLILPDGSKSLIPPIGQISRLLPLNHEILRSLAHGTTCWVFAASSMPACTALPTCQQDLGQARRAMPQLSRNFTDILIPETCPSEQFDGRQRRVVIETLARLLVKATRNKFSKPTNECFQRLPIPDGTTLRPRLA